MYKYVYFYTAVTQMRKIFLIDCIFDFVCGILHYEQITAARMLILRPQKSKVAL